ncbi:hypothetical protein O181_081540 [Austropuccinia psidii MF-1]|uniref:Uncharacterized protein n=1 Tax=Austropuccinia psidii MF-1 TaxID=1389203 RepID=A0A9Q3IJZ9_9BASI|nr:hypothetical protein [Austropuccinia psidii MF-1]
MASLVKPRKAWKWKNLVKEEEKKMEWWKGPFGKGWEGEVLDWWPIELGTTSTSSPSSSSLPSALGLVGESAILLITFTTPWLLILGMGTSELELIGLQPKGMGPQTLVHLATSLFLEPVTNTRYQYHNRSRKPPHLHLEYPEVPSGVGAS